MVDEREREGEGVGWQTEEEVAAEGGLLDGLPLLLDGQQRLHLQHRVWLVVEQLRRKKRRKRDKESRRGREG
jgi:hypothetical protein